MRPSQRLDERLAIVAGGGAAVRMMQAARERCWARGRHPTLVAVPGHGEGDACAVREADEAVPLCNGPGPLAERLVQTLLEARVDAVWGGAGTLVSASELAQLCERHGLAWIGPSRELLGRIADPGVWRALAESLELTLPRTESQSRTLAIDLIGDQAGTVWALGARAIEVHGHGRPELEQLPPAGIVPQRIEALLALAVRVGRAVHLVGAGTLTLHCGRGGDAVGLGAFVPYLLPGHAATEAVAGVDLFKLQLEVADGGRLTSAAPLSTNRHALVAHLVREADPGSGSGMDRLQLLRRPSGGGLRVDIDVREGDAIDQALGTIVATGSDPEEAVARLRRGLLETTVVLQRGATNRARLLDGLAGQGGGAAQPARASVAAAALLCAAIAAHERDTALAQAQFAAAAARGRPRAAAAAGHVAVLSSAGHTYRFHVAQRGATRYRIGVDSGCVEVDLQRYGTYEARLSLGTRSHRTVAVPRGGGWLVEVDGTPYRIGAAEGELVRAPAPAMVLAIAARVGDQVRAGDRLVVLEAMKTELPVLAPCDGRVAEILVRPNVQVDIGAPLVRFDRAAADDETDAAPVRFAAAVTLAPDARRQRALADLRALLLGFDVDSAEVPQLLSDGAADGAADAARWAGEAELLTIFTDLRALFRRRLLEADAEDGPRGTAEYLIAYLRAPGSRNQILPTTFLDKLRRAVAHYGVEAPDRSPALAASLFRIYQANQRSASALAIVRHILERRLSAPTPAGAELRRLLDRLIATTQGSDPAVADLAREVRYQYFDAPFFAAVRARAYDEAEQHLAALAADPGGGAPHIEALVHCPQPLVGRVAQRLAAAEPPLRRSLLEVMTRRYYRIRALEDFRTAEVDGVSIAAATYALRGRRVHALAAATGEADLWRAAAALRRRIAAIPAGEDTVIDLYVARGAAPDDADAASARLRVALETAIRPPVRRIVVALIDTNGSDRMRDVEHFTFRATAQGYVEERLYRGIHPLMAERLHLWRLANFDFERLPSADDVYVFRAVARDNPKDERLFAVAEVRDLTPVRDASGRVVELPYLERMLGEALAGLRQAQARRPPRERLHWNRVLLYVWPPMDLRPDEMTAIIRRLAPATEGLGLEQVLVRARMPDPDGSGLRDRVLRIANPDRSGLVISEEAPPDQPLQPKTEYEQKVVRMRQRGLLYPYELIRMLAPTTANARADFPPGDFVEHDLDDAGRLLAVERPYGHNTANLVVGVIRNRTARYPGGMARVIILGDPSRAMGSVAEPECRRINAALDLAERLSVPVEWFALCSGAKIAMDSGTENMDWCARTIRRIIEFTQRGGEINVIVYGINVGAQSYWNAEATMLMHTRGLLIMTADGAMVLTGKRALDYSGGVSADDNLGIGGYDRIMGPNGQAQYWAQDVTEACRLLLRHYEHTYVSAGERCPRRAPTADPLDRDVSTFPHGSADGTYFATIGDVLSPRHNPERKKPFDIRRVLAAAIDQDHPPLERWLDMRNAESAVVWDAHLGGYPVCLIGIECRPLPRPGFVPADGPDHWTPGTLFPLSSKKVARAINAASANRPVVVLANLSGFDGSPDSMRALQLEYGAEIGRAVVNFRGPFVFCVISRYHGGAYVVFSKVLNEAVESAALEGSYASVIGGAPAAAVVFAAEVEARARADARLQALDQAIAAAAEPERGRLRAERQELYAAIHAEKLGEVAGAFDHVHTVQRAQATGSLDHIIAPGRLRPYLIEAIERGLARAAPG